MNFTIKITHIINFLPNSNAHYTKIETIYFKIVNLLFNEKIDKKVTNWIKKEEQLYNYTFNEYKDVIWHPK